MLVFEESSVQGEGFGLRGLGFRVEGVSIEGAHGS